jgi:putative spermidine/putrescine transport system ATP-binding protein
MNVGLQLQGLQKSYDGQPIVNDTTLTVRQGEFLCFLGPSGCGKTTLLRLIAGLEAPTGGRILLNGRDLTDTPAHERNFAMVFQALALFPFLTVEDNISYALRLRRVSRRDRLARVRELLALIKLPDIGARRIDQLSGGQRQRVAIARALAQEPVLFLLDEPFSALDAKLREQMQLELLLLQKKLEITTILVTHDQREAMSMADSIVVLANGRVQQIGAPSEIYRRPANRFVAGFVGQNNLLEGRIVDAEHIEVCGTVIRAAAASEPWTPRAPVTLCVRPEDVRVNPDDPKNATLLHGHIRLVRDLGDRIELKIDCGGLELLSSLTPADWSLIPDRDAVRVQIAPGAGKILTC